MVATPRTSPSAPTTHRKWPALWVNLGETEEEMLYIAEFAKEVKLDSISFQKLRVEKFSPLKEIVERTPGYYYTRIGGSVYSEQFGRKELKKIRNCVRSRFYNLQQAMHIVNKARRIGLTSYGDLLSLLPHLPILLYRLSRRKRRKKKHSPGHKLGSSCYSPPSQSPRIDSNLKTVEI